MQQIFFKDKETNTWNVIKKTDDELFKGRQRATAIGNYISQNLDYTRDVLDGEIIIVNGDITSSLKPVVYTSDTDNYYITDYSIMDPEPIRYSHPGERPINVLPQMGDYLYAVTYLATVQNFAFKFVGFNVCKMHQIFDTSLRNAMDSVKIELTKDNPILSLEELAIARLQTNETNYSYQITAISPIGWDEFQKSPTSQFGVNTNGSDSSIYIGASATSKANQSRHIRPISTRS